MLNTNRDFPTALLPTRKYFHFFNSCPYVFAKGTTYKEEINTAENKNNCMKENLKIIKGDITSAINPIL